MTFTESLFLTWKIVALKIERGSTEILGWRTDPDSMQSTLNTDCYCTVPEAKPLLHGRIV